MINDVGYLHRPEDFEWGPAAAAVIAAWHPISLPVSDRAMEESAMEERKPMTKVSVITVNRNMSEELEKTIVSVLNQTHPDMEFLVIDGASTDGSLDVIRRYTDHIGYWVSEGDKNLYDAMNKGVRAANGEWIIFMNSGDVFADADVLRDVFGRVLSACDLVYGHAIWHHPREQINTLRLAEPPDVLPYRMNCSHQALFARRDLLVEHPFEDRLLVADYAFLVWAWATGARFQAVDRVISVAAAEGVSDRRRFTSLLGRMQVLRRHGFLSPRRRIWYWGMLCLQPVSRFVKSLLPTGLARMILKMLRKHKINA